MTDRAMATSKSQVDDLCTILSCTIFRISLLGTPMASYATGFMSLGVLPPAGNESISSGILITSFRGTAKAAHFTGFLLCDCATVYHEALYKGIRNYVQ
jgi:hypothetical protein